MCATYFMNQLMECDQKYAALSIRYTSATKSKPFLYQTLKNRATHILSALKIGGYLATLPYYTLYGELPPLGAVVSNKLN